MKDYTVYVSIRDKNESWLSPIHETTWAGAVVTAKSLKEAVQIYYDSHYCQEFIEKNIRFNKIYLFYKTADDKLEYCPAL